jgi:hypothetical protein
MSSVGPRTLLMPPHISGIEVTQAIQYYRSDEHLTDGAVQGPDNSLPIVAGKPAWVRVYLWGGHAAGQFTGTLSVARYEVKNPVTAEMEWKPVGVFFPTRTVRALAAPDYRAQRSTITSTLNFVLPANIVRARLRLSVEIRRATRPLKGQPKPPVADSRELEIEAHYTQTLTIRVIPVAYSGPNNAGTGTLTLAPPTLADAIPTAARAHLLFPVSSEGDYSTASGVTLTTPLGGQMTDPGGCSAGWITLIQQLAEARDDDGNREGTIYVGLLPAQVPIGLTGGCEGFRIAAVVNGDQFGMAHELAHAVGLMHAPCAISGRSVDPNYPTYSPYPAASIGEFGLDVDTGRVYAPAAGRDFMSYCLLNQWISIYSYNRLWNQAVFKPTFVGPHVSGPSRGPIPHAPWARPTRRERLISFIGHVSPSGAVEVRSVRRVESVPVGGGRQTSLVAQLLSARGEVLAEGPLWAYDTYGCRCGRDGDATATDYLFHGSLSNVGVGNLLRIVRVPRVEGGEAAEVWSRAKPGRPPKVTAIVIRRGKAWLQLRWTANGVTEATRFSVQVSTGRGRDWASVGTGLLRKELRIPLAQLPVGRVIFRVLAHDGFHTTSRASGPVNLESRPPLLAIVSPQSDVPHITGSPLHLHAVAHGPGAGYGKEARVTWRLNGKIVGTDLDCWVPTPTRRGWIVCDVTVQTRAGRARARVRFRASITEPATPSGRGGTA